MNGSGQQRITKTSHSSIATIIAISVCAYSACDLIHEVVGHGTAAFLSSEVRAVSLSTVALQTTGASRLVAAAGTLANILAGTLALLLARRLDWFGPTRYFLLLLGGVNLLNGTGYWLFSGALGIGDWAVVMAGLVPALVWRIALAGVGLASYVWVTSIVGREFTQLVLMGLLARDEVPRLIYPAYAAGALLLVGGAAMNPISPWLILESGASTGFGAMAGLLFVPRIVQSGVQAAEHRGGSLQFSRLWIALGIFCGVIFVGVIGKGIRL